MSWANFDDVLDQLRRFGLDVSAQDIEVNTPRPKRCREIDGDRERRGWYWLSDCELVDASGERAFFITGAFGIFHGDDKGDRGRITLNKQIPAASEEQRKAMAARRKEHERRMKGIRKAEIQKAAVIAQGVWSKCSEEGESPYLARKSVGSHGGRFSPSGAFVIPMGDEVGRIAGLQVIRPKGAKAKQYYPAGMEKVGKFHMIGQALGAPIIAIGEGYATCATVHEESGLPVAVAFDAGNLLPVALAIHKAYPNAKILALADDDYIQKCKHCRTPTLVEDPKCAHCGKDHEKKNPGIEAAKAAAHAVGGAWVAPSWPFDRAGKKITDFNDLAHHKEGGTQFVRTRVLEVVQAQRWSTVAPSADAPLQNSGGRGKRRRAVSVMSIADLVKRFLPIDDGTGTSVFDTWTRRIVKSKQMEALLPPGAGMDDVKRDPTWITRGAYYIDDVGFDPTESNANVLLNTWEGWPTEPQAGECGKAVDLLRYLCSKEQNSGEVFEWVLKWLAYPIQNPGAKMRTTLLIHGPQGTGKSILMEAVAEIYGEYGTVIDHGAIDDKFNSDWSSRKLFVIADEIVAQQEKHQVKNQLKGLITGKVIRINPKNLPAFTEANHLNVVFLSNETQALVLEGDDRRHCVIWTPPALERSLYIALGHELKNGGREALHQYLLDVDLGDFNEWTPPPMTESKHDLQLLGMNSVQMFLREWRNLELENPAGEIIPLCPCLGTHLFSVYQHWCRRFSYRDIGHRIFMGEIKKLPGWEAGKPQGVWQDHNKSVVKNRKMIVPCPDEMSAIEEMDAGGVMKGLHRADLDTKRDWLTRGYATFLRASCLDDQQ